MKRTNLLNRVDARLAACAAVAVAGTAISATTADAAIVYSGPVNINIPTTTSGVYLNVVTGIFATSPSGAVGWDVNPWGSSAFNMFTSTSAGGNGTALGGVGVYVGTGTTYFNLAMGAMINGSSTYGGTGTNTIAASTPLNFNSSSNYIGFRFFNEATSTVNYGWMQIMLSGSQTSQPRAIVSYAYDDAGMGVQAGVVPEPSTFALLGLMGVGAMGVRSWRKRKAA